MIKIAARIIGVVGIGLLATVGSANAQSKWTGISIGAGVGGGSINHDLRLSPGPALPPGLFSFEFDGIGGEGFLGTVGVAADYQFADRFVVGAFFDYDFANLESKMNLSVPPLGGLNATAKLSLDNQWTVGARLGFLATPDTLLYGLVGYTHAEISDLDISVTGPIGASIAIGVPSFDGYVLGGGIETTLAPNWTLKAEYRFTQLSAERLDLPFGLNTILNAELEPSIHTVRTTLNYKFNWDRGLAHEPLK